MRHQASQQIQRAVRRMLKKLFPMTYIQDWNPDAVSVLRERRFASQADGSVVIAPSWLVQRNLATLELGTG